MSFNLLNFLIFIIRGGQESGKGKQERDGEMTKRGRRKEERR